MQSSKYDRYIWLVLGLVVVGLCFFASCTSQEEWQATGLSTRIGYVYGNGSYDARGGKVNNDTNSYAVYAEIEPFAYWRWVAEEKARQRARDEAHYREVIDAADKPAPKPAEPPEETPK